MNDLPSPDETRIEGVASHPIRLADGYLWGFAKPVQRLVPTIISSFDAVGRPTESIGVRATFGYPLEIQRLQESLRVACKGESVIEQYQAFFSLAVALLRRTHDIDRSTACVLLSVTETELPRLVSELLMLSNHIIADNTFGEGEVS